jgi:hypothetical protein
LHIIRVLRLYQVRSRGGCSGHFTPPFADAVCIDSPRDTMAWIRNRSLAAIVA